VEAVWNHSFQACERIRPGGRSDGLGLMWPLRIDGGSLGNELV